MSRRPRVTRRAVTILAMLVLLPLSGCGDPRQSYCDDLQQSRKKLAAMLESGSSSSLLANLPLLRDLGEAAPRDVADEWQVFLGALGGLDAALRAAGVRASQFKDGKPPAGLSASDQRSVAEAANRLATEDVAAAVTGIEQQARDVCKVNFGL